MSLKLYNTATRKKEFFEPINPEHITMYVCGPTVYSYAHIGNARPAVVFDLLSRLLRKIYHNLTYIRNITDIDDKINEAAAREKTDIGTITGRYEKIYLEDMRSLNVLEPDIAPKVTESIEAITGLISQLLESGHAYEAESHILFHVPSFEKYGALSGRNREELIAGARVEQLDFKRDPADFVLWKPSTDDQPGWESPWGRGRPGWHIECSAMVEKHAGATIDIHGGGQDLIFPHHENEIAQSRCAHGGREYANYWVHNGFVRVDHEKMSKSIGNVLLVHELLKDMKGEVIRLALLSTHYRQPLDWTDRLVSQSAQTLDYFYDTLRRSDSDYESADETVTDEFIEALSDDLNTAKAMALLHHYARTANSEQAAVDKRRQAVCNLFGAGRFMGFFNQKPDEWFAENVNEGETEEIEAMLRERLQARRNKDFARADRIRDELLERNIQIKDTPDGPQWSRIR